MFKIYRSTKIGTFLEEVLTEYVDNCEISVELAEKTRQEFDKVRILHTLF